MKVICRKCGNKNELNNINCSRCKKALKLNLFQSIVLYIKKNIKLLIIIVLIVVALIGLILFFINKSITNKLIGAWYNSKSPYTYSSTNNLDNSILNSYCENNKCDYSIEDYIVFKKNGKCEHYKIFTNIGTNETNTKMTNCKYKLNFNGTKIKIMGDITSSVYHLINEYPYFPINDDIIYLDFNYNDSNTTIGKYIKK